MTRQAVFTLILALFLAPCSPARAGEPVTVLTSLKVTTALAGVLAEDTAIRVVDVVPEGYFMTGHDAYFKKHREAFFALAKGADAVLTVGSAWPGDPLYRWARRADIRVVNIDATRPLDGYGAGVPLIEVEGKPSPYVWRGPANLARMAAIVADDLCRIAPVDAETVRRNLKRLQGALFRLRTRFETALLDAGGVDLAGMTRDYAGLTREFGLDVRFYLLTPERALSEADLDRFSARLKEKGVRAVVCAWEPGERTARAIREGGAVPAVLERFEPVAGEGPLQSLVDWYEGNLSRLAAALNH